MPLGVCTARKTLADDGLALATRLEGYLGHSSYGTDGGSGGSSSSQELPPMCPPPPPLQRRQSPQDAAPRSSQGVAAPNVEEQLFVDIDGDVQAQV